MSAWEWLATLVMVAVASFIAGGISWHRFSERDRHQDLNIAFKNGEFEGLKAGLDRGYKQAEEAQRRKDSARAHKAALTRAQRRPS